MSPAKSAKTAAKEDKAVKAGRREGRPRLPRRRRPARRSSTSRTRRRRSRSQEKLISVLLAPHITEKTSLAMQNTNTYSFRVRRDSSKPDIKAAVELMFDVKVAKVNVVNETGKTRRFGKLQGRTQDIKKAYVRLAPGQTIDYEAKIKA